MLREEAIAALVDGCPGAAVPCSRYGSTSEECAPVAWEVAGIVSRATGEELTRESLEYAMGLVVNDHDDVEYLLANYGYLLADART